MFIGRNTSRKSDKAFLIKMQLFPDRSETKCDGGT